MNRMAVSIALGIFVLLLGSALYIFTIESNEDDSSIAGDHSQIHEHAGTEGKSAIIPEGTSPPIGPYTPAVNIGNMLFLSGQIGINPATGTMVEGGTVAQARQVFANLRSLLNAAGLTFDDVVRATVYLADLDDYGAVNEEYAKYFSDIPPARVCVEVARIPADALVEISMIAVGGAG
ncbi:Rid family detoxifying hydrolase [Candidatus Zixiibacteriota bacterium]